jgi:hypothetical protein
MKNPKTYNVTVVEVLVHRATISARDVHAANETVREMWDEDGPEAFHTETLGRTDLIVCDEEGVRS